MKRVALPSPEIKGELEKAIETRKSRRSFIDRPLKPVQLSKILWAAKSTPSAGATYPLEIYVLVGRVEGIDTGFYRYTGREIELVSDKDLRIPLARACLEQMFIADAPVSVVICAEFERTTGRYGNRGVRYVYIEVGHSGQNVYLQAEVLGLGTVAIGAFHDNEVSRVLDLPESHKPIYIMPVGFYRRG
ncbi:MAG: SagB/ThcOx family dehydrogenase [Candidatus Syntropharchaeia archaeon]